MKSWTVKAGRTCLEAFRQAGATGVVAIIAIVAALILWLVFVGSRDPRALLFALALAVSAVPFALAAVAAPGRILHPLTLLGLTMMLGVAGQTGYLVLIASPTEQFSLMSGIGEEGLVRGLIVTAVGTAALAIGYVARAPRNRDGGRLMRRAVGSGLATPSVHRMTIVVLVFCGIAVAAFALYAPKVGITSVGELLTSRKRVVQVEGGGTSVLGYHRFGISLAGVAFLLAVYTLVSAKQRLRSRLGFLALLALTLTAVGSYAVSSRSELLVPVVTAVFIVAALLRREPRPRTAVGLLVASLAVVTVLGGLRSVGQGNSADLGEALQTGGDTLTAPLSSRDWMGIGPISAVVTRVPEHYPYQYGATFVSWLWAPIPRSMWADKPPVRLGPEIGPPVYGFPESRRTGDPPGILGELWLNGGILITVVGMAVFGALLRWIARWWDLVWVTGGLAALVYAILAVQFALRLPKSDVTGIVLALIQLAPPLVIALWFCRSPAPTAAPLSRQSV